MQEKIKIRKIVFLAAFVGLVALGCGKERGQGGAADSTAGGPKKDSVASASADTAIIALAAAKPEKIPFSLKEGKRLFSHYCAVCHGESGDGSGQYYGFTLQPSPANFTDTNFVKTRTDEVLFKLINDGPASLGKSNMCPPWGKTLHREEIEFIVAYIKTFSKS
ncbi:MAG: cytochrome c [Chlorobiales bacterium]|jgi:mono/diheme cytochrome c family protein|nr:cytochrome c [Chlorobiales bacterium]